MNAFFQYAQEKCKHVIGDLSCKWDHCYFGSPLFCLLQITKDR